MGWIKVTYLNTYVSYRDQDLSIHPLLACDQYIHLWTNWHPTENNPSIPYTAAFIINTSSWNTFVYTGTGFITVYNGMSVITTKSLNKVHFNKILQSANIFQHKKNSSCSLLIYRLVEITNYFCTLKSVDIYSIVKTVG